MKYIFWLTDCISFKVAIVGLIRPEQSILQSNSEPVLNVLKQ
jgi:hypothetical protein